MSRSAFCLLTSALALGACSTTPPVPPDATVSGPVPIVWIRTDQAWHAVVQRHGGRINVNTLAFYTWHDGICYVYAPDPPLGPGRAYRAGQWASLGHEVKHCFDGNYHAALPR